MTCFEQAFKLVIGEEGGFTMDAADPGNWTGGSCGKGICRGTKYGIAASSHPDLDIANITLAQAQAIYHDTYWVAIHADELPRPLAFLVFDAAVNCGVGRAVCWLQSAAGCHTDGVLGPETLAAVKLRAADADDLYSEFQTQRLVWMSSLPTWRVFGLGWARRLCRLPYLSVAFGEA